MCGMLSRKSRDTEIVRRYSSPVGPAPMAGFFEFSMMRTRGDIDQKALGELFYQYLNGEEDFIKALFVDGETQLGRVFVQEPMLPADSVTCYTMTHSCLLRLIFFFILL